MKSSIVRRVGAVVAGLYLLCLAASAGAQADKKEVLRRAHDSYYSLMSRGLVDFHCDMTPNWEALLAEQRKQVSEEVDPEKRKEASERLDRAIATLKRIGFSVSVGTTGSAKVTHTTVAPENGEVAKGLDQIYTGMEQMTTGFFDTWAPFMISTPFPEVDSEYVLADQGDHWNLSYKEGLTTDVATTMSKDLVIRELKVNTPQFSSSMRPHFTRGPQGLLLAGYEADYRGRSPGDTTELRVGITYQDVNGFQLPQKLNVSGSQGGAAFQVEVAFSGCQTSGKVN